LEVAVDRLTMTPEVSGPDPAPPTRAAPHPQGPWPLTGRGEELDLILQTARCRSARGVAIYGGIGVGKTRLAAEVLDRLARGGWAAHRIAGSRAAAAVPFGALASLLPLDAGARPVGELEIMALAQRAVAARSTEEGLVLVVDDAQCLDDSSAALIHLLASSGAAFVVATVRSGEPVADAITALWKEALAIRVDLQPLSDHDIRRLLIAALGAPVDEPTVFALLRRCAGNTLYLRELVHGALAAGRLALVDGRWRLDGALPPSPALIDLIDMRLGDLPPETRHGLELIAIGEPLPLAALRRLVPAEAIDDAVDRNLIVIETEDQRSSIRFAHPLYGDAINSRLHPLRARAIAGSLASHMRDNGMRRADDLVRYATWQLDAGRPCEPALLITATQRALAAGHRSTARRFADAARSLVESTDEDVELLADARLIAAWVFIHQGLFADATDALANIPVGVSESVWARVVQTQAVVDIVGDGHPERALDRLREGARVAERPETRTRFAVGEAYVFLLLGHIDRARRRLDDSGVATGVPGIEELAGTVAGLSAAFAGRFDEAETIALQGMATDVNMIEDPPSGIRWSTAVLLIVLLGRGHVHDARTLAAPLLASSLQLHHQNLRRDAAAAAGWMALQAGDVTAAIDLLIEGLDPTAGADLNGVRPLALGGLAWAHLANGRADRAQAVLDQADDERRTGPRYSEFCIDIARVLLAERLGQPGRARGLLANALDERHGHGEHFAQMLLVGAAIEIGAVDLAVPAVDRLAGQVDGPLITLIAAEARARAEGDGNRLTETMESYDALGMRLAALRCAGAAVAAHDRAGQARALIAARARAHSLLQACPGVAERHPDTKGPTSGLTRRELEVARLAAQGRTSAEIAEQLFLSVRTVDHHLSRVYLKTGINRRRDLISISGIDH
jgi:DNA-binding CsgD family transcriptional regulator